MRVFLMLSLFLVGSFAAPFAFRVNPSEGQISGVFTIPDGNDGSGVFTIPDGLEGSGVFTIPDGDS